jgi:hypothetical protein
MGYDHGLPSKFRTNVFEMTRMTRISTAARLTIWCLAIFAVMELVFGATMWFMMRRNLYELVDNRVEAQIQDLKQLLQVQSAQTPVAELQQRVSQKYSDDHVGDSVVLYLKTGELVYRSALLDKNSVRLLPPDRVKRPMELPFGIGGRPFRFLMQRISANGRVFVIEMGVPAGDAVGTLRRFQFRLWLTGLLLWIVAGFLIYSISRRVVLSGNR